MPTTFTLLSKPEVKTPGLRFAFFRSVAAAGADWDAAAPPQDIFLQREFLEILEKAPPIGMRFGYLVFYHDDSPVGVAYCQIKYFKGDDNIQELESHEREPCFFTGLAKWFKKWFAGKMAADILILGNMLLTGEHGYHFDYQRLEKVKAMELLEEALVSVVREMEREGVKMPVILVKDIAPANHWQGKTFVEKGFTEFEIQPNMVLELPWKKFDDYLSAMSTKYRTRAKRAFKKFDGIEKRELSLADIQRELPRMYMLYKDVAKNAGFNMVDLNEHYLTALKKGLPEKFRVFGYYFEGRLVAFYTAIFNGDEMEAHFLGYEKEINHDMQIYLNILYDLVRLGIENGFHTLIFSRTALEIKSSAGAVPTDLYCYLRHQNIFANRFAGAVLDYLKPIEEWQQRHPFKEAHES